MASSGEPRFGNAEDEGRERGGWFTGHFLCEGHDLAHDDVEVKWAVHPRDAASDAWTFNRRAHTLSILVRGRFLINTRCGAEERQHVLEREGDYLFWKPEIPHSWRALEESVVVSVRWPSLNDDKETCHP